MWKDLVIRDSPSSFTSTWAVLHSQTWDRPITRNGVKRHPTFYKTSSKVFCRKYFTEFISCQLGQWMHLPVSYGMCVETTFKVEIYYYKSHPILCVETTFKVDMNYYKWHPISFHVNPDKYEEMNRFWPQELPAEHMQQEPINQTRMLISIVTPLQFACTSYHVSI